MKRPIGEEHESCAQETVDSYLEVTRSNGVVRGRLVSRDGEIRGLLWFLIKDGRIYRRSQDWTECQKCEWLITESGLYLVQVTVWTPPHHTVLRSPYTLYQTDSDKLAFSKFLVNDDSGAIPSLQYCRSARPYSEFAAISLAPDAPDHLATVPDCLSALGLTMSVATTRKGVLGVVSRPGSEQRDNPFLFSGSAFSKGTLYFGGEQAAEAKLAATGGAVGTYTYLDCDTRRCECIAGSDFFGVGKIYYFVRSKVAIASNRYHLLLILINAMGLTGSVNKRKVEATLSCIDLQPLLQNFSSEMEIEGASLLPVDHRLRLRAGHAVLEPTGLYSMLRSELEYSPSEHLRHLNDAKAELIENVGAILAHPGFKTVIFDLTGGLDSRLVYAALTNTTHDKDRVRISARETPAEPADLEIALSLNSLYAYTYDDCNRHIEKSRNDSLLSDSMSHKIGQSYAYTPDIARQNIRNSVRVTGAYGEICARAYYSRKHFDKYIDTKTLEEFVEKYFILHYTHFIADFPGAQNTIKDLFLNEMSKIPGRTPLESFENFYLFFRNGIHFSDQIRCDYREPELGPLMSKSLFKAKMSTFREFKGARVQFEMMALMNPVLAAHRYASQDDNTEYGQLSPQTSPMSQFLNGLTVAGSTDRTKWIEAQKRQTVRIEPFQNEEEQAAYRRKHDSLVQDRDRIAMAALNFLIRTETIDRDRVGRSVWHYLQRHQGDPSVAAWNMANRLSSIYFQIMLAGPRALREGGKAVVAGASIPAASPKARGQAVSAAAPSVSGGISYASRIFGTLGIKLPFRG
ncbi:hypothetical protein [Aquabacter spiritensis]|uniref:Asparagine synthase n=1 Tax=Aquabacter spiritensis TaxID=933073 RepID=A0A4R3LPR2_9HYPH|nr:hypothetical protein [Aquabacter spiritensis]TCT02382.1 hypothetical protein EDC64_11328 [Aquabacter spiritensis]